MNKKSFILFITLSAIMMISVVQLFFIENEQIKENMSIEQIQFTQAKYHMQFAKKLIEKIDVDATVTDKISIDGIVGFNINGILSDDKSRVILLVQSINNPKISISQTVMLD